MVFRLPGSSSINYVMRIIGLPGDRIQLKAGTLYLNGKEAERKPQGKTTIDGESFAVFRETLPSGRAYSVIEMSTKALGDNTGELTVPGDYYFVLGDNRDQSNDSRYEDLGFVPAENVFARVGAL